ncbi:MAG: hypothetical protein AAGC55_07240, partial [Myxococcota bacterium]
DVHRENFIRFNQLGLRHRDPTLRFWLMKALEASGEAFFATTRTLAHQVECDTGRPLHYLADRHAIAHPVADPDTPFVDVPFLERQPRSEEVDIAVTMVDTVFDALELQFQQTLDCIASEPSVIDDSRDREVVASVAAPSEPR